jgi:hypothetical protein
MTAKDFLKPSNHLLGYVLPYKIRKNIQIRHIPPVIIGGKATIEGKEDMENGIRSRGEGVLRGPSGEAGV